MCLCLCRRRSLGSQRLQTLKFHSPTSGDVDSVKPIMFNAIFKTAPYKPPHLFVADTLYMLTASISKKAHLMESAQRKTEWREAFHEAARIYQWQVVAWVVLHNHYHAIVHSPEHASNLSKFINSYHKFTARKWNAEDGVQS